MPTSIRASLRAKTGNGRFSLADVNPAPKRGVSRTKADRDAAADRKRLARWQERLWAEGKRSLLVVLQGMDASGKDGTIKHVIGSMNPLGCKVTAFKAPTRQELEHNFLWRIRKALPETGQVGVLNRSHYEDVVVVRVEELVPEKTWRPRFAAINRFEKSLADRDVTVLKFFLHISHEEQARRLLKRLDDPTKRWKFDVNDLDARERWSDYTEAYSDAIARCSSEAAPWYVIPADAKWFRNWAIGRILVETFHELDPKYPEPELDIPAIKARLKRVSSSER